jgi:AcrR family transcriptional regulator
MTTTPDRRRDRREATKREIAEAAWRLSREKGLGGWSLRDLAAEVGMRAPSLYEYFASKNTVYDALFAQGYEELLRRAAATSRRGGPRAVARRAAHVFFDFVVEDPARHQLLFLRTLPGFEPSPESYALATQALDELEQVLVAAGAGSAKDVDLWTAVLTGLATQQASNDPGGTRWARLVDTAVDRLLQPTNGAAAPVSRSRAARG